MSSNSLMLLLAPHRLHLGYSLFDEPSEQCLKAIHIVCISCSECRSNLDYTIVMEYLTIKEALAKYEGKKGASESTFRRLIKKVRDEGGAKRELIKPSEAEVKKFRLDGENYQYTISASLIEEELFGTKPEKEAPQNDAVTTQYELRIEGLEKENDYLKDQLEKVRQDRKEDKVLAQEQTRMLANVAARVSTALPALEAINKEAQKTSKKSGESDTPKEPAKKKKTVTSEPKKSEGWLKRRLKEFRNA